MCACVRAKYVWRSQTNPPLSLVPVVVVAAAVGADSGGNAIVSTVQKMCVCVCVCHAKTALLFFYSFFSLLYFPKSEAALYLINRRKSCRREKNKF